MEAPREETIGLNPKGWICMSLACQAGMWFPDVWVQARPERGALVRYVQGGIFEVTNGQPEPWVGCTSQAQYLPLEPRHKLGDSED